MHLAAVAAAAAAVVFSGGNGTYEAGKPDAGYLHSHLLTNDSQISLFISR